MTTSTAYAAAVLRWVAFGLCAAAAPGGSAGLPAAAAEVGGTPVVIEYGTDVTFTTFNFHTTLFEDDPDNPGLPDPVQSATAAGRVATAAITAGEGQAGVARARVGLYYDLVPGSAEWDDIKDLPVDIHVSFVYTLTADYTDGQGSANAGLAISPLTSPWYDFLGAETTETGTRTDAVTVTYVSTFNALGDTLYLEAYAQAHRTVGGDPSTSKTEVGVNSITFDFDPLPADLTAGALEVTQAVQDLNNSVRLVAGKRTFVRFHATSNGDTYRTFAHLEVDVGPDTFVIYPSTPGHEVNVRANPNRGVSNHAFLFEIPTALTAPGDVEIRGVLNPDNAWRDRSPEELNYDNNTTTVNVTFEAVPEVTVRVQRIRYTLGGTSHLASVLDSLMLPDWLRRAFPLSRLRVYQRIRDYAPPAVAGAGASLAEPNCAQVNAMLLAERRWNMTNGVDMPLGTRYYGMVADGGGFMRGCANAIGGIASSGPTGAPPANNWDTDGTYGDWYGAHEMAHSYGRGHANFCGAAGGPAYPYLNGRISPAQAGAAALYGFDAKNRAIYSPLWHDVMTYCNFQWISDFTYEALMTEFQTEPVLAAAPAGATGDYLAISGWINTGTGAGALAPAYLLEDVENPLPATPGPLTIILRGSGGAALASYPFTPQILHTGPPNPGGGPQGELVFAIIDEMVPYVAGTHRIDVAGPDGLLLSRTAGPAKPVVALTSPNGGQVFGGDNVTVTWTASDADSPALFYNLEYSADDGASWEVQAQGLLTTSATISRNNLAGSTLGRFRVWASDGVHSASGQSDATFTVTNHKPVAGIDLPASGHAAVVSETVGFQGYAYDVESGTLALADLTWTSSLDGLLGYGEQLSVNGLSAGLHTITLEANDGVGGVATDTVTVTVAANPALAPAPANRLVAGPTLLSLGTTAEPVTETLFIDNQSLDVSVNWEASPGAAWVALSAEAGSTPTVLVVSFSGADLPPGQHTAAITLASPTVPGQALAVFVQIVNTESRLYFPAVFR